MGASCPASCTSPPPPRAPVSRAHWTDWRNPGSIHTSRSRAAAGPYKYHVSIWKQECTGDPLWRRDRSHCRHLSSVNCSEAVCQGKAGLCAEVRLLYFCVFSESVFFTAVKLKVEDKDASRYFRQNISVLCVRQSGHRGARTRKTPHSDRKQKGRLSELDSFSTESFIPYYLKGNTLFLSIYFSPQNQ